MKSHTAYLTFNTKSRREFINITHRVSDELAKSGIKEGFALVAAMHITAGVFINDEEDGIKADILDMLDTIAPYGGAKGAGSSYRHHRTGEDNGDAHLKNILTGHQVILPVTNGRLDLGPWQQVFYAEFDGMRPKRLIIKIIGE